MRKLFVRRSIGKGDVGVEIVCPKLQLAGLLNVEIELFAGIAIPVAH